MLPVRRCGFPRFRVCYSDGGARRVVDSMFPTIENGGSASIGESRRSPLDVRIYGLRRTGGLLVKRLHKHRGRSFADSEDAATLGLFVRWANTER